MYEDLTERQKNILLFIDRNFKLFGYPPTVREICDGLNINSTSTVYTNINKLVDLGYLRKDQYKNRAIEVISQKVEEQPPQKATFDVPILGRVQAGEPILAIQNIEDTYPLPIEYASYGNLFILKVQGESMVEAGIFDGDYLIVREQSTAENGEIVVAMMDESATVKRFYRRDGYVELKPENSSMYPILVKDVQVLGKVIGLYRTKIK